MEELNLSPDFLTQNAELLYQLVDMFSNYENTDRDYGGNNYFTMNEIHVLSAIAKNPGISGENIRNTEHCCAKISPKCISS